MEKKNCQKEKKKVYTAVIEGLKSLDMSKIKPDHPLACGIFDLTKSGDDHVNILPGDIQKLLKKNDFISDE